MMSVRLTGALLVFLAVAPLSVDVRAAGPSAIMVYGGDLQTPIVVVKADPGDHAYLSCMGSMSIERRQMGDRPFLKLAIFWNLEDRSEAALRQLKPEQASQHGRLYLPTGSSRAYIVTTPYSSLPGVKEPGYDTYKFTPIPRPLPKDDSEFVRGCALGPAELAAARSVGVPGL